MSSILHYIDYIYLAYKIYLLLITVCNFFYNGMNMDSKFEPTTPKFRHHVRQNKHGLKFHMCVCQTKTHTYVKFNN